MGDGLPLTPTTRSSGVEGVSEGLGDEGGGGVGDHDGLGSRVSVMVFARVVWRLPVGALSLASIRACPVLRRVWGVVRAASAVTAASRASVLVLPGVRSATLRMVGAGRYPITGFEAPWVSF